MAGLGVARAAPVDVERFNFVLLMVIMLSSLAVGLVLTYIYFPFFFRALLAGSALLLYKQCFGVLPKPVELKWHSL